MIPKIISGKSQTDTRGTLFFNNDFDASALKRIYVIENGRITSNGTPNQLLESDNFFSQLVSDTVI